jgi:hypothetical protein
MKDLGFQGLGRYRKVSVLSSTNKLIKTRLVKILFGMFMFAGVFTAGIVWSTLDHVEQGRSYRSAIGQAAKLSAKIDELTAENTELRARISKYQGQLQVDQTAYTSLTQQLSESAVYINELRENVDFYQSIISPQDNTAGVKVHRLRLDQSKEKSSYKYNLTIVQSLKHENSVKGNAELSVEGEQAGQSRQINMSDIGDVPAKLSFRYFQNLQGDFQIPEGFKPERLLVRLTTSPSGKNKKTEVTRVFDWPK